MSIYQKLLDAKEHRSYLEDVLRKVQKYLESRPVEYSDPEDSIGCCISCHCAFECDSSCEYNNLKKLVNEALK